MVHKPPDPKYLDVHLEDRPTHVCFSVALSKRIPAILLSSASGFLGRNWKFIVALTVLYFR